MQESTLLKIAVVSSIVGLILLFVISTFSSVDSVDINKVTALDVDKTVKITGLVSKVMPRGTITYLDITQHNKMPVLIFDTNLTINTGDEVEVTGKVQEYNGGVEIIADRIDRK
jgi:DNA/RNA endonuclease YhcR with UshA esterase domain